MKKLVIKKSDIKDFEKTEDRILKRIPKLSLKSPVTEVYMATKSGPDAAEVPFFAFSAKNPKIKMHKRESLEVSWSSTEHENKDLLHFLFKKSSE